MQYFKKVLFSLFATSVCVLGVTGFVQQSKSCRPFTTRFSYLGSLGETNKVGTANTPRSKSYDNLRKTFSDSASDDVETLEARLASLENGRKYYAANEVRGNGEFADGARMIWEQGRKIAVQGGSLKTWSFASSAVERVQIVLKTEGRPLEADVELWQGPDNTPVKMRVYLEDGLKRPFITSVETPRGPNTVAIRNVGQIEFPLSACVVANKARSPVSTRRTSDMTIQGGALRTYAFESAVQSVSIFLKTDGRPLNARIELLQGPNNNKEVIDLYTEDGMYRPFYMVVETPGSGNVVRVVNTAPVEFPLTAQVEPYEIGADRYSGMEPIIGGTRDW
jgi:hypothetical protein